MQMMSVTPHTPRKSRAHPWSRHHADQRADQHAHALSHAHAHSHVYEREQCQEAHRKFASQKHSSHRCCSF
eukprot:6177956-Pleurochrysis_carterae.AAC.7